MKRTAMLTFVLIVSVLSPAFAQEATREDFQAFCQVMTGRWVGDVTWVADWPGLGKRGDKVTCYWEGSVTEDGNAVIGKFFGGSGSSTSLIFYDAGAKRIKWTVVESGGRTGLSYVYRKDGKWTQVATSSHPDGTQTEYVSTLTISGDGNTSTWTGSGTVGGKKVDDQHDVWRRVSK